MEIKHLKFKQFCVETFCFILLFILLALTAHAGSPVWKVSRGNSHFYLGGTIHILGESDYPLPRAFDLAYGKSDILVFETDIQKSRDPKFTETFMARMVYPDNRTLKKLVRPGTFQALKIFTADRNIPVEAMNKFKPGLVLITLTQIEVDRMGVGGTGVDEFFFSRAVTDGKPRLHLEALEEQVAIFENLGVGNEDKLIAYIIEDLKRLPDLLPVIKTAWRTGDTPGLDRAILGPLKKDFPGLYQTLFAARNQKWMIQLKRLAKTPGVEFVLVGAGHLAGDQGLLSQLRLQGFSITNQ